MNIEQGMSNIEATSIFDIHCSMFDIAQQDQPACTADESSSGRKRSTVM